MERISEDMIIIRKPRNCFGCLQKINRGDQAKIQTNSDDGQIYNITLCMQCSAKVSGMDWGETFYEGDLINETLGD